MHDFKPHNIWGKKALLANRLCGGVTLHVVSCMCTHTCRPFLTLLHKTAFIQKYVAVFHNFECHIYLATLYYPGFVV